MREIVNGMIEFWLGFLGFCFLFILTIIAILLALPTGGFSMKLWEKLF